MYRCYCRAQDGRHEFGIDYPTLADARHALAAYKASFPHLHYYIRRVTS